jgi:hypothetical protein
MKMHTLKVITICLLIDVCLVGLMSCNNTPRESRKTATQVTIHSDKDIIIETLHEGYISRGVYKMTIDSNVYVVVSNDGTAIIKHN